MKQLCRFTRILALVTVYIFLSGCNEEKDARAIWGKIIEDCAVRGDLSESVLYFGPSNTVGVGSIFRERHDGGYGLRAVPTDYTNEPEKFLIVGNEVTCEEGAKRSSTKGAKLAFAPTFIPVNAEIATDFNKSSEVEIKIKSYRWDDIKELAFESLYKKGMDATVKSDIDKVARHVMTKGLYVKGLEGEMKFNDEDAAKLKVKYNGKVKIGELGLELEGNWKDNNTLAISTKSGFYVAGELRPWQGGGLSAGKTSSFGERVEGLSGESVSLDRIK